MGRFILRFFVHPIIIWLVVTAFALVQRATVYAFKRWTPAGRFRRFLLDSVPQWVWRQRLRREARRRAKLLAAEAKGRFLGRRVREWLKSGAPTAQDVKSRRLR